MKWKSIEPSQLAGIIEKSYSSPVLIFKHSTRCGTSSLVLDRLQRYWDHDEFSDVDVFMIDVIANRALSNEIEQRFGVRHESPQAIVIRDGNVVYQDSHMGIHITPVMEALQGKS